MDIPREYFDRIKEDVASIWGDKDDLYLDVVGRFQILLRLTKNIKKTNSIYLAMLALAINDNRSVEWLVDEVKFEALVVSVNGRRAYAADYAIRYNKENGEPVTDAVLDLYNERVVRVLAP